MIGANIPAHLANNNNHSYGVEGEAEAPSPESQPVVIGPAIPPSVARREEEEEEEDDYTPALPPDLLARKATAGPSRPVIGPTLPGVSAHRYEEEEDDDYGPTPLPSNAVTEEKDAVQEFVEREERRRKQLEEAARPKALQREEWMLVPPSSSDLIASLDPTRLKRPRKFAASAQPARDQDTSLWTETPAERQQRLADEVAGKRRRAENAVDPEAEMEERKRRKYDEDVRRGVEEHTRKVRGAALLDQHGRDTKTDKKEDEEPAGIWDHGRDMALGGRLMDDKSRQKIIQDARGLSDRFGTGKSGGYL